MNDKKPFFDVLVKRAAVWGVILAALAPLSSTPAFAANNYVVFGQVRQINPDEAKDSSIPTASLKLRDPLPFTPVAVFNRSTQAKLAESWTGANGQYTLSFSAGSPVDIEVRAFLVVDGGLTPLKAARDGINDATLTSLGATTSRGLAVKVASSLITAAGSAASTLPYPGVGIVFTRVGKVEIGKTGVPYIQQNLASPDPARVGLADLTGDPARAGELGLPVLEQAPFSGRLLIFGGFGLPGGGAGCAGPINWYQVTIEKIRESTLPNASPAVDSSFTWTNPMSKKRYAVQTFPFVDVTATDVTIGPYSGRQGLASGPTLDGLYMANDEPPSTTRQVFYSFPDLRVNWVSDGYNGLYRLRMRYFRHLSWAIVNEVPVVEEIPPGCFVGPVPPAASAAAVGQLVLRVNNQPLLTSINHIWLKNPSGYLTSAGGRVPTTLGALDFNNTGLCKIMQLVSGDKVEVDFTARHEGGYLRSYSLGASSNDGASVPFIADNFHDHPNHTVPPPPPPPPLWYGTDAGGISVTNASAFPYDCGYFLSLAAASRQQNGYDYYPIGQVTRTYYIRP